MNYTVQNQKYSIPLCSILNGLTCRRTESKNSLAVKHSKKEKKNKTTDVLNAMGTLAVWSSYC
jgi:hypothetical protein